MKTFGCAGVGITLTALMALHYFGIGPKKETPDEENETCLCEQQVPGREEMEANQ